MATTFASLGLGSLTNDEKLELIGQLWEEFVALSPPAGLLTEAQRHELRRREADDAANSNDRVAWKENLCP
jgi:putative addiction module component (TIGR02574 family)